MVCGMALAVRAGGTTGSRGGPPAFAGLDPTLGGPGAALEAAVEAPSSAKLASRVVTEAKTPPPAVSLDDLVVLPLAVLSPQAASLAERFGTAGVAVIDLEEGVAYAQNPSLYFPMLSTAKVPIMLALMQQALDEGRPLSEYEASLLYDMITFSDNDAAYALWDEVGGGEGLGGYLESIGVASRQDPYAWGSSEITALEAAELMARLQNGDLLDGEYARYALSLLAGVDEAQAWGAVAGAPPSASTGVKNGWYVEPHGWLLNSVGYVDMAGKSNYTVAIYTAGATRFYAGIDAIEGIAAAIHVALAAH
jgi:hypothetical protein